MKIVAILDESRLPFREHARVSFFPNLSCLDLVVYPCEICPLRCKSRIQKCINRRKDRTEPHERLLVVRILDRLGDRLEVRGSRLEFMRIRPRFDQLLADPDWLPDRYREPAPESGMGGGVSSRPGMRRPRYLP